MSWIVDSHKKHLLCLIVLTMYIGNFFLQTPDEKVWLDVEIGWKKPAEPPYAWDEIRSTLLTITLGF